MPSWTFLDDYGTQYPALAASFLGMLSFSNHTLTGTSFTGDLDVSASGVALSTIAALTGVSSIPIAGQVTNSSSTLTVTLAATDGSALMAGLAQSVPLIGRQISSAGLSINTIVTPQDSTDTGPQTDVFDFTVTLTINSSSSITLTTQVPMHGGLFTLDGTFQNMGVSLNDLGFLVGKLASGNQWFPSSQLGPYYQGGPALSLLGLSLTLFVNLSPLRIAVSSVSIGVGITGIDLTGQKLYLSPIGVWAIVEDPANNPSVDWAIEGSIALCNYARPGQYQNPDFAFDFAMDLTSFSISGQLENKQNLTVATMMQDLLGQGVDIGLPPQLTIDKFDFEAAADLSTGQLTEFSTDVAMSGGFGLFSQFDLEEISISFSYSN